MEIKFTALDLSHSICKFAALCLPWHAAPHPSPNPPWRPQHDWHIYDNRCSVKSYLVHLARGIQEARRDVASEAEVNFYKQIYTFHFVHVFNITYIRIYAFIYVHIYSKKICKLSVLMKPRHSCYIPCMQMLCDTKLKVNSLKIPS